MKENIVKIIAGIICCIISFIICFSIGSWLGIKLFKDKILEKTYTDSGLIITIKDGYRWSRWYLLWNKCNVTKNIWI